MTPRGLPLVLLALAAAPLVGCYRTTTVEIRDVDRLVTAQGRKGEVEVSTVQGERATVDAPLRTFAIVPAPHVVFMTPPGSAGHAEPVRSSEIDGRLAAGWSEVDLTIQAPFFATADRHSIAVAELPLAPCARRRVSVCGGLREGRPMRVVQVPADLVRGLGVEEPDGGATAGATVAILVGGLAAVGTATALVVAAIAPRHF